MRHYKGSSTREAPFGRSGFTLIELLVVIAVLAVLAVVVVLVSNPAGLLQESRDSNRISDMATLNSAINLYSTDVANGFYIGSSSILYISIPDPTATSTAGDQCQGLVAALPALPTGYTYQCAASSTYRKTDGTGWIPVNFSQNTFGTPLSVLPVDPINTTSSGLYYEYMTNGQKYEVAASFESPKYLKAQAQADGGTDPARYETGSSLTLLAQAEGLVGLWGFDEGGGTVANDSSGNNAAGTYNAGVSWPTGKVGPYAVAVGTNTYANNGSVTLGTVLPAGSFTLSFWMDPSGFGAACAASQCLVIAESSPASGFRSGYADATGKYYFWTTQNSGSLNLAAVTPSAVGVWDYYTVTYAAGVGSLYRDGVLQASSAGTYTGNIATNVSVDAGAGGVDWFWGSVDDVRIYSRALSAAEVQALYNAEK